MRFFAELIRPNIFTGVLAIFVGLIGFYVTNVVESLRSGYTAVQYFEPDAAAETVVFHLVNISRTKRIDAASFEIKCANQADECFSKTLGTASNEWVSQITTPPNFGRSVDDRTSGPAAITVCLGAIASSRTSVRVAPVDGKAAPLMALYDPWSTECRSAEKEATNLLLLGPRDPHALIVQNYFTAILGALAVSAAILAVTGIGVIVRGTRNKKEDQDEESDIKAREMVFLSYRIGDPDNGTHG